MSYYSPSQQTWNPKVNDMAFQEDEGEEDKDA